MKTSPSLAAQRGFTLVMTLIFLVIFMLFAISMVSSSMINTRVAANQQYRLEAGTVAQKGIEQVMSQPFIRVPITTVTPVAVDVNGDGKVDFTAQVAPPPASTARSSRTHPCRWAMCARCQTIPTAT